MPPKLDSLVSLNVLNLAHNQISGLILMAVTKLSSLYELNLSQFTKLPVRSDPFGYRQAIIVAESAGLEQQQSQWTHPWKFKLKRLMWRFNIRLWIVFSTSVVVVWKCNRSSNLQYNSMDVRKELESYTLNEI